MTDIMIDGHKFPLNTIQSVEYKKMGIIVSDSVLLDYDYFNITTPSLIITFGTPVLRKENIKSPVDLLQFALEEDMRRMNNKDSISERSKKTQTIKGSDIGNAITILMNNGYYTKEEAQEVFSLFQSDLEIIQQTIEQGEKDGFVCEKYKITSDLLKQYDFKYTNKQETVFEARDYLARQQALNKPEFFVDLEKYRR